MLTALVTGADGQLGMALKKYKPENISLVPASRVELDITDKTAVTRVIGEVKPDFIINAAAYTAVDKAESDVERAFAINELGPRYLAEACAGDTHFVHVSTDFVFDGTKNTPYTATDKVNPVSIYGKSKLAGEQAVMAALSERATILRTSWVYGIEGGNFLKSMLRLMNERDSLGIVVDQLGTPTSVDGLAEVCWRACEARLIGTFHWSDAGVASWYDFAEVIMAEAIQRKLLRRPIELNAITSEAYPTPAKRPHYSVLDKSETLQALPGLKNMYWQEQLKGVLDQLATQRV